MVYGEIRTAIRGVFTFYSIYNDVFVKFLKNKHAFMCHFCNTEIRQHGPSFKKRWVTSYFT